MVLRKAERSSVIRLRSIPGQGYATEALTEMLRFGFAQLGLQRIGDCCAVENLASARVMEKCGLRLESEQDGERSYAITAGEWQAMQRSKAG